MLREKDIEGLLGLDWNDEYTFYKHYQPGEREREQYLSLNELIVAFQNTLKEYQQYEVSASAAEKLMEDIFRTSEVLKKDLIVRRVGGKNYLVGGRHRLFAIKTAFDQLINHPPGLDPKIFYRQLIRVDVLVHVDLSSLGADILADNGSRSMRVAEQELIKGQQNGADPMDPLSFVRVAFDTEKTAVGMVNRAAQYFERACKNSRVKGETRRELGRILSSYIIFGSTKLKKDSPQVVEDAMDFQRIAEELWEEVEVLVLNTNSIARKVREIASAAITKYEETKKNSA